MEVEEKYSRLLSLAAVARERSELGKLVKGFVLAGDVYVRAKASHEIPSAHPDWHQ